MWTVQFDKRAEKELSKLPRAIQKRILHYLEYKVAPLSNPRDLGAALTGPFAGLWKYRVGDYRIVAHFDDRVVTIFVVGVGNRRDIYR